MVTVGELPHLAASKGRIDVLKYLIEDEGANIDSLNNHQQTPLWVAAYKGQLEVVQYLAQQGAEKDKAK